MSEEASKSMEQQAAAFIERLEAQMKPYSTGKVGIDLDALQMIVREEPELTIVAARSYLGIGKENRGYYQLAVALGAAYKIAFNDDSLALLVQQRLEEEGATDALPTFAEVTTPSLPEPPKGVHIVVDADSLRDGDIYALVRAFSVNRTEREQFPRLRSFRGRCIISFPLDDDPRPVWKIPEVRHFISRLFEAMPYFPYYLAPAPELGMFRVFFGSLADLEAVTDEGLNLVHSSVLTKLAQSLSAIIELSEQLGEDSVQVGREVLSGLPEEFVSWFLASLQNEE